MLEVPGKYLLVKSRKCRRGDTITILDRWVVSLGEGMKTVQFRVR